MRDIRRRRRRRIQPRFYIFLAVFVIIIAVVLKFTVFSGNKETKIKDNDKVMSAEVVGKEKDANVAKTPSADAKATEASKPAQTQSQVETPASSSPNASIKEVVSNEIATSIKQSIDGKVQSEQKSDITPVKTETTAMEKPSEVKSDTNTTVQTGTSPQVPTTATDLSLKSKFSYIKNDPKGIYAMINKENGLASDYKPIELTVPNIKFPFTHDSPKKFMRKEAAAAIEKLCADALKEGHDIQGVSGYRSYDTQKSLYDAYVKKDGQAAADKYSAKPGHSEHQSGLVMDVSCKSEGFGLEESFGKTKEGKWLKDNAHKYGFIIRYPQDKIAITKYSYEPWHIRFIGVDAATYMYENNLCLEEFYDLIGVKYNK